MTDRTSPWVSRPQSPLPSDTAPPAPNLPARTGPSSPQNGVPVPDRVDQLRIVHHSAAAPLWWVGVHGGAGESSLAELVPEWQGSGRAWPQTPGSGPARVVLVARSNARGLRAAQMASMQWAAGLVPSVEVLGLVVIADAPGRLPRPLRDLMQVVSGGLPRTWNVPWIQSWRLMESSALADAPSEVRRLVDELRMILGAGATGSTNWKEER